MSSRAAAAMYPDLAAKERVDVQKPSASGAKPSWASTNDPMWQPSPQKRGMTTDDYRITSYWLNRRSK